MERRTDEAGSPPFREANHSTRKADGAIRAINFEGEAPCARRLLARQGICHRPAILSSSGLVFKRGLAADDTQTEALWDGLGEFVNRRGKKKLIRDLSWWAHQDSNLEPTDYESA
jgi:hypothetical protein